MEFERVFAELTPRLGMARALERELDRNLAHRFNVFDYLRVDELGLSRIIADLLNHKAKHGQGTLFLKRLLSLEGLKNALPWPGLDGNRKTLVVAERWVTAVRRIDISVEIIGADGEHYCLAFENKPSADDRKDQVWDYLKYLREEYGERFLLIYLSPTGEGPSEESLPKKELDKWKGRFAIMPYCAGQEEQAYGFDDFRIPRSLADWLGECRNNCEVDRLCWFLRDFETFCRREFGGQAVTTNREKEEFFKFVFSGQSNLETALAVSEHWPDVKEHICQKFLERLCSRIKTAVKENEKLKEFAEDMSIRYECGGTASYLCSIWLYGERWNQYPVKRIALDRRTHVLLQNQRNGPNEWGIGVRSPMIKQDMPDEYMERRECLETELKRAFGCGQPTPWCPWWLDVDEDKKNWSSLIPDLYQENENQSSEITKYFVDKFIEIAETAVPIINGIEG